MKSLPKGVTVKQAGDAESLNELSEGFASAMQLGLMMVYAVLVMLFGSFLQPITILFSLPLSIGGAIGLLLLTGKQLTIPVWIGIMMLMGIVTKNAIMLVDFAVESIGHGMDRDDAIVDAGQKRARPIIMTTIAMIAGMMPSALAFGAGGEFRSPMAHRRDRRPTVFDRSVAGLRSGCVFLHGRRFEGLLASRQTFSQHRNRHQTKQGAGARCGPKEYVNKS